MHNRFESNGLSLIWMDCEISIYSNYKFSKFNPAKIDHSSFFLFILVKLVFTIFLSFFIFILVEIRNNQMNMKRNRGTVMKKKIILIFHDINGHGCYTYTEGTYVFDGLKHPYIFSRK